MIATTYAPALIDMNGQLVTIECDITNGLPGLVIVGLGDKAVEEARERLRSALKNSQLTLPPKRITVNLAPANMPKDGSGYDLGMCLAVLAASGQLDPAILKGKLFLGELALNGSLNSTRGSIIAARLALSSDISEVFVPAVNADDACLVSGVKVFAISSLSQLYHHLLGHSLLSVHKKADHIQPVASSPEIDFLNIYGQLQAKRAIEVAAAGGHNILLTGPPGTGKSLLAKAIPGLLPPPSPQEIIEITSLHSLVTNVPLASSFYRPFRSPHHTASKIALIGGGSRPRPGEISLSHCGILFMDEIPEFPRSALEVLRQPLEDGSITVARAHGSTTYPARFMLVATANPCPCGYAGDPSKRCHCSPTTINRYQNKLSGPLLDRIDIVIEVSRSDQGKLFSPENAAESTSVVAARVSSARHTQMSRNQGSPPLNAYLSSSDLQKHCKLDNETTRIAHLAMDTFGMSARGYTRTLKVARTIADLDSSPHITLSHFNEALQYRPRIDNAEKNNITASDLNRYKAINAFAKARIAHSKP